MALVFAYLPDRSARARLTEAAKSKERLYTGYRVSFVHSWGEVEESVRLHPGVLVVFDPYATGRIEAEFLLAFRAGYPSVPLFAYGDFRRHPVRDVLWLGRLGVSAGATLDHDDSPTRLRALLADALSGSAAATVLDTLGNLFPADLRLLLQEILVRAGEPLRPEDAARLYYRHPKTLRDRLRRYRLPSPEKLIVWARLFLAAHLLQDPERSVADVALCVGFPSPNALRNQFQRYAGTRPGDLRQGDGLARVLHLFRLRYSAPV
jgi:AraC-like DNA-binding protein